MVEEFEAFRGVSRRIKSRRRRAIRIASKKLAARELKRLKAEIRKGL